MERNISMKVLISAYACEPGLGSEPEIGWNWSLGMAEYSEVWTITRASNQIRIEEGLRDIDKSKRPNFVYYDLPLIFRWWKKHLPWGTQIYYFFWQMAIIRKIRIINNDVEFDFAQHITFGNMIWPIALPWIGIPFIIGPVGGGEYPVCYKWQFFRFKGTVEKVIRRVVQRVFVVSPLARFGYKRALKIYVTTQQSYDLLPLKYQKKTEILQSIAINEDLVRNVDFRKRKYDEKFRIVFMGRLCYWKGVYLVAEVIKSLSKHIEYTFSFIGEGSESKKLRSILDKEIDNGVVVFYGPMQRKEAITELKKNNVLLFPSFQDSGGMVVYEAMAAGVVAFVLDVAGPGVNVNGVNGVKFTCSEPDGLVEKIVNKIEEVKNDSRIYSMYQEAGRDWVCKHGVIDNRIVKITEDVSNLLISNVK